MSDNKFYVQRRGPFSAGEELVDASFFNPGYGIHRVGIQAPEGHLVKIDGQDYEIGSRGILEFNEVLLQNIEFLQNEDIHTFVDFVVKTNY